MSTAVASRGRIAPSSSSARVAMALARVEGRCLVRHPLVIAAWLLGGTMFALATWSRAPVLHRDEAFTIEALAPAAGAALIATSLATGRARRHGTTELMTGAPSSTTVVTLGHLLSVLWVAAASAVVALGAVAYLKAAGGVGTPRAVELLTGPALVALGGALGVVVGRWLPHPAAGPLALAGSVGTIGVYLFNAQRPWLRWLSPYAIGQHIVEGPTELGNGPSAWHLAYVVALVAVVAVVALLRHARSLAMWTALCVALGVASLSGLQQTRALDGGGPDLAAAIEFLRHPERFQVCDSSGGVRYCAFEAYEPWMDRWREVIDPVLAAVPVRSRPQELFVRQIPTTLDVGNADSTRLWRVQRSLGRRAERSAGLIAPGMRWGRNSSEGEYELGLALDVAAILTGLKDPVVVTRADLRAMPRRARRHLEAGRYLDCNSVGQGRSLVALYIAGAATPGTEAVLARTTAASPLDENSLWTPGSPQLYDYQYDVVGEHWLIWGYRELHYAAALLSRPEADVKARLERDWERFMDPGLPTDAAAAMLGLDPLPTMKELYERYEERGRPSSHFWGRPACD